MTEVYRGFKLNLREASGSEIRNMCRRTFLRLPVQAAWFITSEITKDVAPRRNNHCGDCTKPGFFEVFRALKPNPRGSQFPTAEAAQKSGIQRIKKDIDRHLRKYHA